MIIKGFHLCYIDIKMRKNIILRIFFSTVMIILKYSLCQNSISRIPTRNMMDYDKNLLLKNNYIYGGFIVNVKNRTL